MKKYILTSLMSLLLIAGTSLLLTATEPDGKQKASGCCSSEVKAEATQTASSCTPQTAQATSSCSGTTASTAACCSSKTKTAEGSEQVQVIQTAQTGSASSCTSSAAACTGSSAVQTASGPQPGECTKVPSGIRSQQTSNSNP